MKIIINGRFLTQPPTGVQNYAKGIVNALQKTNLNFEIVVPKNKNIKATGNYKPIGIGKGWLWEQFFLPLYISKQKNSRLINLCNSAPILLNQQIVTIHDLAFCEDKQWFKPSFRMWYNYLIPRICKKARLVFTVSKFSKAEIMRHYNITENKIKIIPNGFPPFTFDDSIAIKEKYILITGANNRRKNVEWIINNIEIIKQKGYKLVVLGDSSSIFNKVNIYETDAIFFLKDVSVSQYYSLLKNAKALLFPSLYEGFGIPILESLCLGTPVITSNLKVFKESFGELPIYFSLNDSESFSQAIEKVKNKEISPKDIDSLKNKFNFENSVAIIIENIEMLINENSLSSRLV